MWRRGCPLTDPLRVTDGGPENVLSSTGCRAVRLTEIVRGLEIGSGRRSSETAMSAVAPVETCCQRASGATLVPRVGAHSGIGELRLTAAMLVTQTLLSANDDRRRP
jgi:hypothetical protein